MLGWSWSPDESEEDELFLLSSLSCLLKACWVPPEPSASRTMLERLEMPFRVLSLDLVGLASAPIGCSLFLDQSCPLLDLEGVVSEWPLRCEWEELWVGLGS